MWLSEVMLQQTQVATVIPYYRRFIARFPSLASLAAADVDEVMKLWSGLGYYSRARNLHRAAIRIVEEYRGEFPRRREELERLSGIGRSTAAAIAVFCWGRREAVLDANVKRVLARHFALRGFRGDGRAGERSWRLAESLLPARSIESYTQGLMDLGATVCRRAVPLCGDCPLNPSCAARALGKVDRFPSRAPKKSRPSRATTMLLLLCDGEILLEKRPPTGVWGGLWSLPEIADDADLERRCRERFGCEIASARPLAALEHGFTHFSLTIRPLVCRVHRTARAAGEARAVWVPLVEAAGAAVPAPVKQLLRRALTHEGTSDY